MEGERKYIKEEIKNVFWKTFHKTGEVWFDYIGDKKECEECTLNEWSYFEDNLDNLIAWKDDKDIIMKDWIVIDKYHKWFGRKVNLIANLGRGIMSAYLIGYGTKTDYVRCDQIKKLR